MIRAICIVTAFLKLVATYHVPIPTITKEIDGTKVDLNVGVHIDTGDDSPSPGPGVPWVKPSTQKPEECVPVGGSCTHNGECCDFNSCIDGRVCGHPFLQPKEPKKCVPKGQKCILDGNCCYDLYCGSVGGTHICLPIGTVLPKP